MKSSYKIGLSFGLTSGVITTLGLLVGLDAGTHSQPIVLGGILTIAVADSCRMPWEFIWPKKPRTTGSVPYLGIDDCNLRR